MSYTLLSTWDLVQMQSVAQLWLRLSPPATHIHNQIPGTAGAAGPCIVLRAAKTDNSLNLGLQDSEDGHVGPCDLTRHQKGALGLAPGPGLTELAAPGWGRGAPSDPSDAVLG